MKKTMHIVSIEQVGEPEVISKSETVSLIKRVFRLKRVSILKNNLLESKRDELITTKVASEMLSVTVNTVQRYCREKKLFAEKFGSGYLISKESVESLKIKR